MTHPSYRDGCITISYFSFPDEPGKPGTPEVIDYDKDHMDLKWDPPTSDGGSPITGYVVEKKDKYGNWEKAVEVPADQTTATVGNLTEGQPYEFRVRALNKAGPGEPSEASKPVVAKPKNCKFAPVFKNSVAYEPLRTFLFI